MKTPVSAATLATVLVASLAAGPAAASWNNDHSVGNGPDRGNGTATGADPLSVFFSGSGKDGMDTRANPHYWWSSPARLFGKDSPDTRTSPHAGSAPRRYSDYAPYRGAPVGPQAPARK